MPRTAGRKTKQNKTSKAFLRCQVGCLSGWGRWACMESVRNNVPQVVGSRFAHAHMHTFKLSSKNASTKTQNLMSRLCCRGHTYSPQVVTPSKHLLKRHRIKFFSGGLFDKLVFVGKIMYGQ